MVFCALPGYWVEDGVGDLDTARTLDTFRLALDPQVVDFIGAVMNETKRLRAAAAVFNGFSGDQSL